MRETWLRRGEWLVMVARISDRMQPWMTDSRSDYDMMNESRITRDLNVNRGTDQNPPLLYSTIGFTYSSRSSSRAKPTRDLQSITSSRKYYFIAWSQKMRNDELASTQKRWARLQIVRDSAINRFENIIMKSIEFTNGWSGWDLSKTTTALKWAFLRLMSLSR